MKRITMIIGGSRSGKSRHALTLAESGKLQRIFIATCMPHDDEMRERIDRHKAERSDNWRTLEEPIHLAETISEYGIAKNILLVDCLTLWINNLFLETDAESIIAVHLEKLIGALADIQCPIFLVTNEVGTGIVPENQLARQFRDAAGWVNQRVAECADQVIWMVAGIPVTIKTNS